MWIDDRPTNDFAEWEVEQDRLRPPEWRDAEDLEEPGDD